MFNDDSLTMYMVTHKNVKFIPKGRTPIFVGNGNNLQHYLSDNTKDNISNKNKNYCELTALYWIWKNDKESKYVSIEHYRRFFMDSESIIPKVIPKEEILSLLKDGKIVVPRKQKWAMTVGEHYRNNHSTQDFYNVFKIIKNIFPEYVKDFNYIMSGYETYLCNMVASSKDIFDRYCEWLFTILFKLEKMTDLTNRTPYQQRAYGFMSERLFNVWLHHNINKDNIVQLPIYYRKNNSLETLLKNEKALHNKNPYAPKLTGEGLKQ